VRDHASLGFLTVRANQTVSITGAAAPTGQLALVDAAITVMAGGTLVLRAVHVAQDVTVQPGGAVQNLGSLVSSDDDDDDDDARSLCCVWSGRERAQQLPRHVMYVWHVMYVCRITSRTCMRARAEGALTWWGAGGAHAGAHAPAACAAAGGARRAGGARQPQRGAVHGGERRAPAIFAERHVGADADVLPRHAALGGACSLRRVRPLLPLGGSALTGCTRGRQLAHICNVCTPASVFSQCVVWYRVTQPLVTTEYRMATQAEYTAWWGTRTYGGLTERQVAGDQAVQLNGNVTATPLRLTATPQSLRLEGDRLAGAPPEWRSDGGTRRAFYLGSGRLSLEYVTIVGWRSGPGDTSSYYPGQGGAIHVRHDYAVLLVQDAVFKQNSLVRTAGSGCQASLAWYGPNLLAGGAIYIYPAGTPGPTFRIINTDFVANSAQSAGNDAVYWHNKNVATVSCGGSRTAYLWAANQKTMYGGTDCCAGHQSNCMYQYGRCLGNGLAQSFYWTSN
jgi:hypothetical protein